MIYLLTQIFLCLLVAFLLGLLLGWLLWGRERARRLAGDAEAVQIAHARIASLEADLAACQDAATAANPAAATMGLFGAVAEAPVDDLKRISGVGPVIEKQLAGIGITTFRQIANLTSEDIQTVQSAIGFFPGRIEQEDWRAQAAQLHRETYGDDA
jgi:predicted flap endonuclease-1-like 5' DNA nuclease